ncbi:MAG: TolC family outer membrane protein [Lactobacillus sp.]|jgi:outer membrane protein|nr:TolC family outer membrane protein [Lactobacillus sp.]
MKKSFLSALLLSTMICTSASAKDLIDVLSTTYQTNPTLRAQRAYLRAVDENVAIAKSGYRPNLYLQGGVTEQNYHSNAPSADQRSSNFAGSANLSQSLFSGFQTMNSVKSADSLVRSEQSNLANVEQEILLTAATAYLDVFRDTAIVELQKNNEKLLKKRLDETIERFNVGEVTRTDVAQSRARHSQAQSDRISAEGNLEVSKAFYERVVGEKVPATLTEPDVVKPFLPKDFEEAMKVMSYNNHNIKQAKDYLNSKTYDVAVNTGALLPSVSAEAVASRGRNNIDNWNAKYTDNENLEASLNLKVPLYNSGSDRAKIRQSKYQKWQAHEQVLVAERSAVEVLTSSWESMISNEAKIKSIRDQVKANEIALDGVQKEESLGNRTVLDVLDAYQELLNSNVEEVTARRNYYVSAMSLLLSMGQLTAEDLKLNVEYYNAKEHYKETRDKWFSTDIDKE